MPDNIQRLCPICRDAEIELTPCRSGCLSIKASPLAMVEDYLEAEIYVCPRCQEGREKPAVPPEIRRMIKGETPYALLPF